MVGVGENDGRCVSAIMEDTQKKCHDVGMLALLKVTQSCLTLCNLMDYNSPWNSPGQNTGVGSLSLLQGIFPTQGSSPGLPHWHKGSPRILEWVAYPFSSGSS